jgi:hypothetical protein
MEDVLIGLPGKAVYAMGMASKIATIGLEKQVACSPTSRPSASSSPWRRRSTGNRSHDRALFRPDKRYVDALAICDAVRHAIFEGNARRAFRRLDAMLKARDL